MLDAIGIQRRVRPANLLRIGQALEEHVLPVRQLESARLHSHTPSPGQQFSADATLEDKENAREYGTITQAETTFVGLG